MNPKIDDLIVAIQAHAAANNMTNAQALELACVRLVKRYAAQLAVSELNTLNNVIGRLGRRHAGLFQVEREARETVATTHQAEVDAIVSGTNIAE